MLTPPPRGDRRQPVGPGAARRSPQARAATRWHRARATIAGDVLAARARAAAQVRAAGARVLEAPPDRLPGALVAAYLRAKSRAVL